MKIETRNALQDFSEAVAMAIAREANGKDVAWLDVIQKQEALSDALDKEDVTP